jgi:hypothetical protein
VRSGRKFVNITGEIEHEEPEPLSQGSRPGGHARSYSRAASVGFMSDQKTLELLADMKKVRPAQFAFWHFIKTHGG